MNCAIATQANTSHFEPRLLMVTSLPRFFSLVQASIYTGTNVTSVRRRTRWSVD
jgi:hypothetical protein